MRLTFRAGGRAHDVDVTPLAGGRFTIVVDGERFEVSASVEKDGTLRIAEAEGDGAGIAMISRAGAQRFVTLRGTGEALLERVDGPSRGRARRDHAGDLAAPMPGKVVALRVAEGDDVARGQLVAVVEAMKMEMPIVAPRAGRVARVRTAVGDACEAGEPLIELAEETS